MNLITPLNPPPLTPQTTDKHSTQWQTGGHKGHCAKTSSPAKTIPSALSFLILVSLPVFWSPLIPFQTNARTRWILDNNLPPFQSHMVVEARHPPSFSRLTQRALCWSELQSHTSISLHCWFSNFSLTKHPHKNHISQQSCKSSSFCQRSPKLMHVFLWTAIWKKYFPPFFMFCWPNVCAEAKS